MMPWFGAKSLLTARLTGCTDSPATPGPSPLLTFRHPSRPHERQDLTKQRSFRIAALVWPDGVSVGEPEGRLIGTIRLHSISWLDRKARLAIGIFDRRFWSHGYGTEAIRLLLRHGFEDLSPHRIDLRVLEYNTRAIRAYEKCGFIREGIERESALVDGCWYSDVIMGILAQEYRAQSWTPGL